MKKSLIVALITFVALAGALANGNAVFAETTALDGRVLNHNADAIYYVLGMPQDVLATEDGVFIRTASGWSVFKDKTVSSSEIEADDLAFLADPVILKDGDISYNGKVIEGTYTALSAYGDVLYALSGDTIYKFVLSEGALSGGEEFVKAASDIGLIAATPDGCAYSVMSADGHTGIIYVDGKEYANITRENILDMAFSDKLYVLTPSSVLAFTDRFSHVDHDVEGAVALDAADKLYVLTRSGSLMTFPPDLRTPTTLIAAGSDLPWFYSSPTGGDTRLGKIFVADRDNDRVAVISGTDVSYLDDVSRPISVAADNGGKVYVAHHGNKVACFRDGALISDDVYTEADIIDIEIDFDNKVYCLTEDGEVISDGKATRSGVKAFNFGGVWRYLTDSDYIDDELVEGATSFCVDAANNIFATDGSSLIAITGDERNVYTLNNAAHIASIELSKVDNELISYGDLILFDDINNCLLVVDGEKVGSVNVTDVYPEPQISDKPSPRTDGLIATTESDLCMFRLPVEGEIVHVVKDTDRIIVCKDIPAPEPFAYCLCDDADGNTLHKGYIYTNNLDVLPYSDPANVEVKINVNNTPVYKYPSINAVKIAALGKGTMVSVLPFAATFRDEYDDGWYTDIFDNMWYRIAYGTGEGYVLAGDATALFFSEKEMPKANATITENAVLYRYDETTGEYVEFVGAGPYIAKDTRVKVETPYDSSRQFTKIVFYREGYGTIDSDCYVKTKYVRFDGADVVKIIAFAVIAIAFVTLIFVIIRKRKNDRKRDRTDIRLNQ